MISLISDPFIILFLGTFFFTLLLVPLWIKRAKQAELMGKDIHKNAERKVAEMGGIIVLLGFLVGVMAFIALRVFILDANSNIAFILASLTAVLIAGIIGIMDDILGWKIGLSQWQKPLLTLLVAAPVIAVNGGTKIMDLAFIGHIDLGILYPLVVIPLIIIFTSNSFNMLAGFNGLEAGQGMLLLSTLAYFSLITGQSWLAVLALCMVFSLAAFWVFNIVPAKVFPGDTLTYSVGALIGIIAILANLEKILFIIFIPYLVQFSLKLRGRFKKESFAKVLEDNTLVPRYEKFYGLENMMVFVLNKLKVRTTEMRVVLAVHFLQIAFIFLAFLV